MKDQALSELKQVAQSHASNGLDIVELVLEKMIPLVIEALEKQLKDLFGVK